jgi:hypothetical protein
MFLRPRGSANYETQHALQIDLHECSTHQREIIYKYAPPGQPPMAGQSP